MLFRVHVFFAPGSTVHPDGNHHRRENVLLVDVEEECPMLALIQIAAVILICITILVIGVLPMLAKNRLDDLIDLEDTRQ